MPSKAVFTAVGCLLTFILFVRLAFYGHDDPSGSGNIIAGGYDATSTFSYATQANRHSLSQSQCGTAFPNLSDGIKATVAGRKQRPVSYDEVKIAPGRCMLQVLIYENEVYVTDTGDHLECYVSNGRERITATLSLIHRAVISSTIPLPNIEFPLSYDDLPLRSRHGVVWGYARKSDEDDVWLIPDYGYWAWWAIGIPSFTSMTRQIAAVNDAMPFQKKDPRAVWRGTPHYAPALREKLLEVTADKSWADVKTVEIGKDEQHFLGLNDHCKYQYVVQTEGTSYSGRFKFLQHCNSVIVAHKLEYAEFASHLMVSDGPKQNFVEVERDWSDLDTKMQHLVKHPSEAAVIAKEGHQVFAQRYLTPAAVSCYLRSMIEAWATVQGFEPQLTETNTMSGETKLRGIPFEAFIDSFPQDKPGEYGRFAPS